jgi:hypothetical protein
MRRNTVDADSVVGCENFSGGIFPADTIDGKLSGGVGFRELGRNVPACHIIHTPALQRMVTGRN